MKSLIIHLETTGRYLFREPVTHPDQPHLARLAFIAQDNKAHTERQWSRLIKPQADWDYEADAIVAHGIHPEVAEKRGLPLRTAMMRLTQDLEDVDRVVAFNIDFVKKVLERSAFECGLPPDQLFAETPLVCAMRGATDIVRVPRMAPGGGYSWPKLRDAHSFFSGDEELPPLDLDPEERGIALAECVLMIQHGIDNYRKANQGVSRNV